MSNQTFQDKIILDLCGGTGAWSKPYKDAGYDVRLITLPEHDVRLYQPPDNVYGILAAPPCTHFAVAGARWWKAKGEQAILEGLATIDACLRIALLAEPVFWCLENPVGRLKDYLGPARFIFQPYEYGDIWSKRTCLWGEFEEPLKDAVFCLEKNKIRDMKGNRKVNRSITPPGFAQAFFEANSIGGAE